MNTPFIDLASQQNRIRSEIKQKIETVLNHGQYIMGPEVTELEDVLSKRVGVRHVVTCGSGTDALLLALMGLKLKPGQGVIVPSFTFTASVEVMPLLGAIPIFAEIDEETYTLNPSRLKDALQSAKNSHIDVVGIMAVGLFGQPAQIDEINAFAKKNGFWVLDDAAQSFGTEYRGRKTGSLTNVTCTSFFPAKPLGCYGDGGAIFTDNNQIKEKIESLRAHGKGKEKYQIVDVGLNSRLDTIQAAILLAKLKIFEWENIERNRLAKVYTSQITDNLKKPLIPKNTNSVWAQYTITSSKREKIIGFLGENNIPTMIYYPIPMHRQPAYKEFFLQQGGTILKNSDFLAKRVFSVPIHAYLSELEQEYIIEKINEAEKKF